MSEGDSIEKQVLCSTMVWGLQNEVLFVPFVVSVVIRGRSVCDCIAEGAPRMISVVGP